MSTRFNPLLLAAALSLAPMALAQDASSSASVRTSCTVASRTARPTA